MNRGAASAKDRRLFQSWVRSSVIPCCDVVMPGFIWWFNMTLTHLLQLGKSLTPGLHGLSFVPDEMQTHVFNHLLHLKYCEVILLCLFGVIYSSVFFFLSTENVSFLHFFFWLWFIVIGALSVVRTSEFCVGVFTIVSLVWIEWKCSCKVDEVFHNHCFFK